MGAAAIIFFAFYGFDAISTAAEEAKNPSRDLTIGIVGSMVLCTVIYMVVGRRASARSPFDVVLQERRAAGLRAARARPAAGRRR